MAPLAALLNETTREPGPAAHRATPLKPTSGGTRLRPVAGDVFYARPAGKGASPRSGAKRRRVEVHLELEREVAEGQKSRDKGEALQRTASMDRAEKSMMADLLAGLGADDMVMSPSPEKPKIGSRQPELLAPPPQLARARLDALDALDTLEDLEPPNRTTKHEAGADPTLADLLHGLEDDFAVETWSWTDEGGGEGEGGKGPVDDKPEDETLVHHLMRGRGVEVPVAPDEKPSMIPLPHVKREEADAIDTKPILDPAITSTGPHPDFALEYNLDPADFAITPPPSSPAKPEIGGEAETSPQHTRSNYPVLHPPVHSGPRRDTRPFEPTPWCRCVVRSVTRDKSAGEAVVLAKQARSEQVYAIYLVGHYAEMQLLAGDVINIVSPAVIMQDPVQPTTPTVPPVVDVTISLANLHDHLILHPDVLVPMTSLAGAFSCRRKPLVQSMIKEAGAPTKPLLYGNIIHELLQAALQTRDFSAKSLRAALDEIINRPAMQLDVWAADIGLEELRAEVWEKVQMGVVAFGEKWVAGEPRDDALLHTLASKMSITGLHDIEESIWSPKWGLKGKVDASIQAALLDSAMVKGANAPQHILPFEIKTGRAVGVMEHRAQTMLYTLLMEERYRTAIDSGILYYTQTDSMLLVPAAPREIKSLLEARNELAVYMARERPVLEARRRKASKSPSKACSQPPIFRDSASPAKPSQAGSQLAVATATQSMEILPPTIDNFRECRSCYSVKGCMLFRKAIDRVDLVEDDPLYDIYSKKVSHITDDHATFFARWEHLITVEERDMVRLKNQLWTLTATEREKTGRCFADMVVVDYMDDRGASLAKIHQHTYHFARATGNSKDASFLNGHISKGDPVSLSIEPDLISIARGFVLSLSVDEVVIGTNQRIEIDALMERTGRWDAAGSEETRGQAVFRIDKDEMLTGTARMRNNLAQLLYSEEDNGDSKRRQLIVDLEPPDFQDVWAPDPAEIPAHLNTDQAGAMRKVLTAKDYALILGMPGTGKTTTIAAIIKALVDRGKSVLLASYTHSAVDTILMKMVNSGCPMLRIGNVDKVHPDVAHLTLDSMDPTASLSQLDARLMSPQIVATTCLSIDHPIFARRKFDYCIVDEASQITLPTCIGPLRFAETFVLVGDHFQLPPIVRHPAARRGGLDISLFRLLSKEHPEAVADLAQQYRMNEDIMSLSNSLIYGNRLRCGSGDVAQQSLKIPVPLSVAVPGLPARSWLHDLLQCSRKAIFVDTDRLPARDSRVGDLVQNIGEATLIHQLTSSLLACGIKPEDIAVITPYRQQIKLISARLADQPGIEILTADKSQGRDKDCIIISMVRSNELASIGELLRDWRRINVSFTRAKRKLVIFGSRSTLQSDRLLAEFFKHMESRDWVLRLPGNAAIVGAAAVVRAEARHPSVKVEAALAAKQEVREMIKGRPFLREALHDVSNLAI